MRPSNIIQMSVGLFLSLYLVSLPLSISIAFIAIIASMFVSISSGDFLGSWQLIAIGFVLLHHARKGYEAFNSAAAITSSSNQLSNLSMMLNSMRSSSSIAPVDPKTSVRH